jgi:hypothetical protein
MNTFPFDVIAPLIVVAKPPDTWFRSAEVLLGSEKVIVSPEASEPPAAEPSEKLPQPNTVVAVEAEIANEPEVPLPMAGYVAEPRTTERLAPPVFGRVAWVEMGNARTRLASNADRRKLIRPEPPIREVFMILISLIARMIAQ